MLNVLQLVRSHIDTEFCDSFIKILFQFFLIEILVRDLAGHCWPNQQFVHICSRNNFPTAAGLASSAAGYACLVYSLCKLFDIHDTELISTLARLGSGSACRSVYGGFVQWIAGYSMETSIARQVIDENAWPQIRILILVVSDHRKDISSTSGMRLSATTSDLISHRVNEIVPERTRAMLDAIERRDFNQFAEITMKDSNQFHSICQDTYPPIRYMNDSSWSVVGLIHRFNAHHGSNVVAYTFDAGPNACLYCLDNFVPELLSLIELMYSIDGHTRLELKGIQYEPVSQTLIEPQLLKYAQNCACPGALKYLISSKIGSGPEILSKKLDQICLLGPTGLPK